MRPAFSNCARSNVLRGTSHYSLPSSKRFYASANIEHGVIDRDIVIVGGGPAGLAFANALVSSKPVRESLRIALVEAGDLNRVRQWSMPEDAFSNRVSSITNASKQFLEDINGWKHVDSGRTTPIEEMQVWDGVSDARITFNPSELGFVANDEQTPYMAHMTENLNLQRALLQSLDSSGAIEIIDNAKVSGIEKDQDRGGWPLVHISNGMVLRARLLVGADGPNSPVRSYAAIDSYGWAYDTRAIVATLRHRPRLPGLQRPNTIAYQRFLPTGPIAFLPLSPTVSSLVWSTKPPLAEILTKADPCVFAYMINSAFRLPVLSIKYLHQILLEQREISPQVLLEEIRWRERSHKIDPHSAYSSYYAGTTGIPPVDEELVPPLVTSIQQGSIASFPLHLTHADTYVGEGEQGSRTALLGDAAHTIHPLAGQGLNMGLADAQALAGRIHSAVCVGNDIGSRTALLPYARSRYIENHKLLSIIDKLHKVYSTALSPIVLARSVGLEIMNELDFLKAAIMMSAGSSMNARHHQFVSAASPWSTAARAVEIAGGTLDAVKIVGRTLRGAAAAGLRTLADSPRR